MSVQSNINIIEERIHKACNSAGRKREEITLMGVSKFIPIKKIEEAYSAGIRCFGESRVQEALDKYSSYFSNNNSINLHMIGSLQRNKAKIACGLFDCIQSVDRIELINELAKHVHLREKPLEILLEVHTAEDSKSGFDDIDSLLQAAELVIKNLSQNPNCFKPAGLMTMAPYFDNMNDASNVQAVRDSFRKLAASQNELEKRFPSCENYNWNCLSMGMSNDFEIAIEEGATMLRIGSLIFKE